MKKPQPIVDGRPAQVIGQGLHTKQGVRVTLRVARAGMGKTQVEIENATGINHADITRLESKPNFDDCTTATLRRYIESLGGKLELVATFKDHKLIIVGVR